MNILKMKMIMNSNVKNNEIIMWINEVMKCEINEYNGK